MLKIFSSFFIRSIIYFHHDVKHLCIDSNAYVLSLVMLIIYLYGNYPYMYVALLFGSTHFAILQRIKIMLLE